MLASVARLVAPGLAGVGRRRLPGGARDFHDRAQVVMMDPVPTRLLAVPTPVARTRSSRAVADAAAYADAAACLVVGPRDARATATVRDAVDAPVLAPATDGRTAWLALGADGPHGPSETPPAPDVPALCAVPSLGSLDGALAGVERAAPALLLLPALAVAHDPTRLASSLPGAARFGALAARLDGPVVVLAGGQPAGYAHRWRLPVDADGGSGARDGDDPAEIPVHGLGAADDPRFAALAVWLDGRVAGEDMDPDSFGLRAVAGVGRTTAERLRQRGVATRVDLAATAVDDLAAVEGVSESAARRMRRHVEVIDAGEPVRTSNAPLPGENGPTPVCLDVETDGLTPTIVWQFGLYDPRADEHVAVVEDEDPDDPASVVREFCDLLFARFPDRPVLAWNGDGFDFPVIDRFVRRHAPAYTAAWADAWTVDLLAWARENALLPGRTNQLDDVARALGHERAGTGLTGARTAAAYRAFRAAPDDPAAEPDWERHRAYCEDDCRALWRVYEALADADRRVAERGVGDRQTGLGEFR